MDDILDNWGLGKLVTDALRTAVFDKLSNPTTTPPQYQYASLVKDIGKVVSRIDSELKSLQFLAGDSLTIADLCVYWDVAMLKLINFDLSKSPSIRKWQKEVEHQLPSLQPIQQEFDALVKSYASILGL